MNERIVCAANRDKFGDIVLGVRHHCKIMDDTIKVHEEAYQFKQDFYEQGFVTNTGRFVLREEAWVIAEREGQILRRVGGDTRMVNGVEVGVLYSENLY